MVSESAFTLTPRWTADCNMVMQGAAVAADLTGDGNAEFLTAAYQAIIAVDAAGKELWRVETKHRFMACPAVWEREGDFALVYAGDMAHSPSTFFCIDGAGDIIWQAETAEIFWSSAALGDLDNDGRMAVIVGDSAGTVHAWDALTGDVRWTHTVDGSCSSPAVGDLNGDGKMEVVVTTTTGKLYILDSAGEIIRERTLGGVIYDPVGENASYHVCSPVIFTNSRGHVRIATAVAEPGSRRFLCLDSDGETIWDGPAGDGIPATVSVADFNGDGRADIFAIDQSGQLFRWDEDGALLWNIDTQAFCFAPGAIADVNGDGALEYVLCTELGGLFVFDQSSNRITQYQLDSRRAHRNTPAIGIVDDKLVFATTGGDLGRMYAFECPASGSAPVEWRSFRGEPRGTGTQIKPPTESKITMVPENLAWNRILTTDEIVFRVENPNPTAAPLTAEATMTAPDGSHHSALGIIVGHRGVLRLPVTITAPHVYRFTWRLTDESGAEILHESTEVTLSLYVNDRACIRRALLALRSALSDSPTVGADHAIRALLRRELSEIERESAKLSEQQEAVPGASAEFVAAVLDETRRLTSRAQRALTLAKIAPDVLAHGHGTPIIPFEGHVWENRGVDAELPEVAVLPVQIRRRCVAGEHEPISLKLFNATVDAATVHVHVESAPDGLVVTPHEARAVPTNAVQDTIVWDPLVSLSEDDGIRIPSCETREVWLDIDTAGVSPGTHRATVVIRSGPAATKVEIALDVLPFEMASYDAMRLCMWARYDKYSVPDLLAHGNTVFPIGAPKATAVEDGDEVRIDVDFSTLESFVEPLIGHDVFLLLTGVPNLGIDWREAAYVPRLASYLDQVMAWLAERGIPEEHVALYTWDEVGGHGWDAVRRFVEFGRQALTARPGIKIYVNGGGDLPMFEELAEIAAIWSPAFFMLDEHTPVMNFLRNTDAALWTYNCAYMYARPLGWNTKAINLAGEHRMQAVFAANYGATGIGYWCYNIGESQWDPTPMEYPIVYHTAPDEPIVISRRWEAVRESVEDARIVVALRERLDDSGTSDEAKAKIRHLLDVSLPRFADKSLAEMHLGTARYVLDDTNNDETVDAFRTELLNCVEAVVNANNQ